MEVLVGDQTGADFGVGFAGQHGLGAFARMSAPDAAHVEAGAYAGALLGGVALLAMHRLDVELFLIGFLVEGGLSHEGALLVADDQHVVVEAGYGDVVVLVVQAGNHLAEYVDGVGDGTAVDAAVEVVVGAGHFHLPVAEAAQAAGDAGYVGGYHTGVADEYHIALEQLLMLLAEAIEAGGADLFFAFEHEFDVAGELAGLDHEFESLGLHETLSFVVVGTTGPYLAVLHHRLEGAGAPEFKRRHGHHVVVAVYADGGLGGVDHLLAIHHGVAGGGHHFGPVASGLQQKLLPFLRATEHVGFVLAFGTDGGDSNEFEQLF